MRRGLTIGLALLVAGLVWRTNKPRAVDDDLGLPPPAAFQTRAPALPQVLVTHELQLKDGRSLVGASAFFVQDPSGPVLVTAGHLLGHEGGFDPPVPPSSLASVVLSWIVHPRTRPAERTSIGTRSVVDVDDRDLLVLSVAGPVVGATPLIASGQRQGVGHVVFLVGCAYAEDACVQQVRPMVIQAREGTLWWAGLEEPVRLQGFSGAPVVDAAGDAVGVLVSGLVLPGSDPGKGETHAAFEALDGLWRGDVKP